MKSFYLLLLILAGCTLPDIQVSYLTPESLNKEAEEHRRMCNELDFKLFHPEKAKPR